MKKFIFQALALIILIFAALAYSTGRLPNFRPNTPITEIQKKGEVKINQTVINVEIADTGEKRKKGLGDRESFASNSGMLFIFDKPDTYSLWMKGMKFPLDFIWIRENSVVDITKDAKAPEPGTKDQDLPVYKPNLPVTAVLEVNAGFADLNDIKIGDAFEIIKL